MDCIKKEFVRTDAEGHKWWRVVLTATEAPDSLQLTGADVDGMDDNIRFEAGSVLLTPDKNYIAFEDGNFSGGGGTNADGVQSITISPSIDTDPTLASFFPIEWDDLTPDEKEGGKRISLYTDEPLPSDVIYTITVTPSAEWYAWNAGISEWGEKGEPVSWTQNADMGWLDIITGAADNTEDTLDRKNLQLGISLGND